MDQHKETGVVSNTNTSTEPQNHNSSTIARPYKIQKIQIPPSNQIGLFTEYQPPLPFGEGTSNHQQSQYTSPKIPEEEIIQRAYSSISEFITANTPDPHADNKLDPSPQFRKTHQSRRSTSWKKPDSHLVKANSDANLQEPGWWGLGAIVRNSEGLVMASATWKVLGTGNATLAEAIGVLYTMRLARDCGFRKVVFEGDNEKVWKMICNNNNEDRTYLGYVILEIQRLQSEFDIYQFMFTHRECNATAHQLAQLALSDPGKIWIEDIPPSISEAYVHDFLN